MTRHIALSERQQAIAEALIDGGRFASIDQVIDEGLRLIADHRPTDAERHATLRVAIEAGVDDLDQGRFTEFASREGIDAYLDDLLAEVVAGKPAE